MFPLLVAVLVLGVPSKATTDCFDYLNEQQCMNTLSCFYLINEQQCVPSPTRCADRRGMKMCHRAYPKQCRWNQTTQHCQPYEWNSCGMTTMLPCGGNCSFNWDIAECVSLARNESDMSYYYWCGQDDQHPLQWGLVNESTCHTQKGAHCAYVPAYGLCMPKPQPKKHVIRRAVQRWEEITDQNQVIDGYGVFDAMLVLVGFIVLFCVFLVCLDATTQIDKIEYYTTYRQRWPGRS